MLLYEKAKIFDGQKNKAKKWSQIQLNKIFQ
jgi:hypothetical protein